MLNGFWKGKNILLTGHTGFKGTWMCLLLEQLGANVYGYSLPIEKGSFFSLICPRVVKNIEADIADTEKVFQTIKQYHIEIVFHLASHSSLNRSMEIPHYIFRTNLMGTLNVLEACRKSETVRSVVIVTSDKCYFDLKQDKAYKENSLLWANDPYSSSKVCQEILSECYLKTFFKPLQMHIGCATARASNVIGPGDYNLTRLLPYIFNCLAAGKTPNIRNPYAIRPWQFVLDVLNGYLLLAQKLYFDKDTVADYSGAYNFGPEKDGFINVEEITKLACKFFTNASYQVMDDKDHIPNETNILKLDSTKSKKVLHWLPRYSLETALEKMAEYMKKVSAGEDEKKLAREMTVGYLNEL